VVWLFWVLGACNFSSEAPVLVEGDAASQARTLTACDSVQHETTGLGEAYSFDFECAIQYLKNAGCDFALDPNGDGEFIASSAIEDLVEDAANCQRGTSCTGCDDGDSASTIATCTDLAKVAYWTESEWADLSTQCPVTLTDAQACAIDGVQFTADEAECATRFFATMDCDSCADLFDSRVCEDAINDPATCQVGGTCTGCDDGDARANGVTCGEIEAYSYLGPVSAQQLLDHVRANPCTDACVPVCEGRTCGDDGCGGTCGECGDGDACDTYGQCTKEGCTIEDVYFNWYEKECALTFFEGMDCATCDALLPSRVCEDAINNAALCQKGDVCTGCDDQDTIDDGVSCDEIAGYAYLGSSTAADLLAWVQADVTCGVPDMVVDGVPLTNAQATSITEVANRATLAQLDDEAGLSTATATALIDGRNHTINSVAATSGVGQSAMEKLRDYSAIFVPIEIPDEAWEDDFTHDEADEIPDADQTGHVTQVRVQGAPPDARAESVVIDVLHDAKNQIEVELIAPNGARYLIWDFETNPPTSVDIDPEWVADIPPNGTWTLAVRDYTPGVIGESLGWNLHVATP